jgi:hypothetical protein
MSNMNGDPDFPTARIPPTGGSGTAPPRDTVGSFVAHLRAEIDRLTALHRAELEHNRRLTAACSLYRSAAMIGRTGLANVRSGDTNTSFDCEVELIDDDVEKADGIAIPTEG